MTINHIILGVLSLGNYTGYDLKKIIADNDILPWTGNNNQIYKALVELKDHGWVTSESVIQDSAPNKKIYTLSESGRVELRAWLLAPTELTETHSPILAKLLFADSLLPEELTILLESYREELLGHLEIHSARWLQLASPQHEQQTTDSIGLSDRIRQMTNQFLNDQIKAELHFTSQLLKEIKDASLDHSDGKAQAIQADLTDETVQLGQPKPGDQTRFHSHPESVEFPMQPILTGQPMTQNGNRYIEVRAPAPAVSKESDVVDLLTLCSEYDSRRLLIEPNVFCEDFFRLKTGLAGTILQKLVNYHVRAALIRGEDQKIKGKFMDFLLETNRGQSFRIFENRQEAVDWLCKM